MSALPLEGRSLGYSDSPPMRWTAHEVMKPILHFLLLTAEATRAQLREADTDYQVPDASDI
jgi:hypothetical protein